MAPRAVYSENLLYLDSIFANHAVGVEAGKRRFRAKKVCYV